MSTIKDLQDFIKKLRIERENEAKQQIDKLLENFFQQSFIEGHRPWHAVIGNKRCKPVPIHYHIEFYRESSVDKDWMWPDMPESFIREYLETLGFVLTKGKICVSVPAYKKGEPLSFAQKWVRKINHSYSVYCLNEKKLAKKMYSDFIQELIETPVEKIKIRDGYVLFEKFKFSKEISRKCYHNMKRTMKEDGYIFEVYDEKKNYIGVGVEF